MAALAFSDIPEQKARHDGAAAARGARVFAQGRWVLDFDNLGGTVILGHADPEVDAAAAAGRGLDRDQLRNALTERLAAVAPCTEDIVLLSSSRTALKAAVDLARRATGRSRIIHCTTPSAGPQGVGADMIAYGDVAALAGSVAAGDVAAILVVPIGLRPACPNFLAQAREVAHRSGAVLIFDETASAFRVHEGGAQVLFGVSPDLSVLGEALGNGRPIAALAGRRDLLEGAPSRANVACEHIAAAIAVMDKLVCEPVVAHLCIRGAEIQAELSSRIRAYGAQDLVAVAGDPTMTTLVFADAGADPHGSLRAHWDRECAAHGLWRVDQHFISYAHGDAEIARLLEACEHALAAIVRAARRDDLFVRLPWSTLEPEFGLQ